MSGVALTWCELAFPTGFGVEQAIAFTRLLAMRPLHGLFRQPDPVVCEVVGTPEGLRWRLGMTGREAATLLPQLRTQLPGVHVDLVEARGLPPVSWAVELRLERGERPLRTDIPDAVTAALLTAVAGAQDDETVVMSWLVGPWLARPVVKPNMVVPGRFGLDTVLDADDAAALRTKFAEPVLGVVGRIGVETPEPARRGELVDRVLGALDLAGHPGVAFTLRRVDGPATAERLTRIRGPLFDWSCPLNAAEFATVLGWPIGNPYLPGVAYRGHRQLPAPGGNWLHEPAAAAPGRHRVLGRATYPGQGGVVHLPATDARQHLHVIGPTGAGKSVLLSRLIEADIAAGRSVVVIEPKADLITAVCDRIPAGRTDEVVLLDPADREFAVGLDLLSGADPDLTADRFVSVLRELFRDAWGPRTAQVLHAGLLALARTGGSLVDLPHLLTNPAYRHAVLERSPDPLGTGPFWAWFDGLSEPERTAVVGPSLNRLGTFTSRRAIRAAIGQADPRFAMSDVFTSPRVLLVNLAKGLIGPEAARLLGALVFSQLWQTALARGAIPPGDRRTVMVYVDEFQDYTAGVAADFGDLLAQARGLGVGLTLAHQGLHQLDATTQADVLTNARSRVVFQAAGPDAGRLAEVLGGDLTAEDLAALGRYQAYAALMHDGATQPPASLATLPPEPGQGTTADVRQRSREQWATPIAEIDTAILARRQPAEGGPLGVRRRRTAP